MRIAMLAPPWIPIPAPAYGGIEEVIRLLCDGLVAGGLDVTLFAPAESDSAADVHPVLDAAHPDEIAITRWEVDHVARAFASIEAAEASGERGFDVVHDHCGHAALAMGDRLAVPLVHTAHGPFDGDAYAFYAEHGHKATIVALSRAQLGEAPPALRDSDVISNPVDASEWTLQTEPGEHVLWIGRMSPVKGAHRAIAAAREAGVPLVLAGPVQPGQEEYFEREVEPAIDGDTVKYVGEVPVDQKNECFGSARAVLMPIRWTEPFGMVMVEAMVCGTPVIAFPEGSAPELVIDGETGFLVEDEHAMAAAIGRIDELDRRRCRELAEERFDVSTIVADYARVYERAIDADRRRRAQALLNRRGARGPQWAGTTGPPPRAPRAVGAEARLEPVHDAALGASQPRGGGGSSLAS